MRTAQRTQIRRARAIADGFGGAARCETWRGDHADEVWVLVDGVDQPVRILPGRRGVAGQVILPVELESAAYAMELDLQIA